MEQNKFPSEQPTRKAWQGMMNRAYTITNKDYPSVGGKGIKVCDRWFNNYENFLSDMGEKPTDSIFKRHDEGSDFSPENCYWQPKVNSRTNPLYSIWKGVKRRCGLIGRSETNTNGAMYTARGVKMDPDWEDSFATFAAYVGERPSGTHQLDRIDNNSGYYPGNVRWATPKENANNRCDNVYIEIDGQRKTLSQWAVIHGLSRSTVGGRFTQLFWPIDTKYHNRYDCEQVNTTTGQVINTFRSAKAASEATGILRGTIAKCLSGGNATAGGFAWRYKD